MSLLKSPEGLAGISPKISELHEPMSPATPLICPGVGQISLINSPRITSLARSLTARNRLRLKANFVSEFKLIGIVSAGPKIFLSGNQKIALYENRKMCILSRHPVPIRGVYRDRHGRWAGCGGRGGAIDERRSSGRRSRVVLTPRRWCQVLEGQASLGRRWQESPVTGESTK